MSKTHEVIVKHYIEADSEDDARDKWAEGEYDGHEILDVVDSDEVLKKLELCTKWRRLGNRKLHLLRAAYQNARQDRDELRQKNKELTEAIQGALRISELWLYPEDAPLEHEGEAVAMASMFASLEKAIGE